MASEVFARAVVAPRSPRRILVMTLDSQVRLMVIADAAVLKGRDPVDACRRAVRGGATLVQIPMKGAPPRDVLALAPALVAALEAALIVNQPADLGLAGRGDSGAGRGRRGGHRIRIRRTGSRAGGARAAAGLPGLTQRARCRLAVRMAARCSANVAEKMCFPSGCATK